MIYHVLNGDSLAENFNLEGEKVICRECLIDGNLISKSLDEFWQIRANFIGEKYNGKDYFEKVKSEFDKLENLNSQDEVNLWFGNEAFCQTNLWFILWFLSDKNITIYRVLPDSEGWNCTFENLANCFENRILLTKNDVQKGKQLWKSFCFKQFELTDTSDSKAFPHLKEVCQAIIEKEQRPKEILSEITANGESDFGKIFTQFKQKAGIYGFGDSQVKNILAEI